MTALSRKWRGPETAYRSIPRSKLILGTISSPILVEPSLFVVNMIAQDGYPRNGECALDYQALRSCLDSVSSHALRMGASVHCPRIGAGLAGGDWELIEKLLIECLVEPGTSVTVYDLPSGLGS